MKNYRLKMLYSMLLAQMESDTSQLVFRMDGICNKMNYMRLSGIISNYDFAILQKDFLSRKPGIFSKFYWNKSYHSFQSY